MGAPAATPHIGPNAITRVAEALGPERSRRVFGQARLGGYLLEPPQAMVDEAEVVALHGAVRQQLGPAEAQDVLHRAGDATARYLLAHRIPRPVQWSLRRLPAPLAARLLLRAIRGHAWTFAGSGAFSAQAGPPSVLVLARNPLCRGLRSDAPACDYFAAVFERLFRTLVHPQATLRETACEACGEAACVFEIRW